MQCNQLHPKQCIWPSAPVVAASLGVQVQVMYCNEPATFTPEQLVAMVMVDLKRIAEEEGSIPVTGESRAAVAEDNRACCAAQAAARSLLAQALL